MNSTNNTNRQKGSSNSELGSVTPNTPLRLEVAARLAFPDGSMKLAGLRREIARGRLAYEVIAGKHYTTLADIDAMRQLCRVPVTDRASISALRARGTELGTPTTEKMSPQELLRALLNRDRESKRGKR